MRGTLLLLVLALACVQTSGPAACTVAAYQDQGVAITYLKPSFTEVRAGSVVDLYAEYQNVGEAVAKTVRLFDMTDNGLGEIKGTDPNREIRTVTSPRLQPPDPEKCIPGELKKLSPMQLQVSKDAKLPKEGLPVKLLLVYDYTASAWSDILTMSRDQWLVRSQKDTLPQTFEWVSAAPVKAHIAAPKTPIIDDKPFLVKLWFTNEISGGAYATTTYDTPQIMCPKSRELPIVDRTLPESFDTMTTENCLSTVEIKLPEGVDYDNTCTNCKKFYSVSECNNNNPPECDRYVKSGDVSNGGLTLTMKGVAVNPKVQQQDTNKEPRTYYLQFELTEDYANKMVEEMQKLKVDAYYTYRTEYSTTENIVVVK